MRNECIENLKPGMITADTVKTRAGQVVIKKGVELTQKHIDHLSFYSIKSVSIDDSRFLSKKEELKEESAPVIELSPKEASVDNDKDVLEYQKKIRDSIEYKHFKQTFLENVDILKNYINDLIYKCDESAGQTLLNQTLELFDSLNGTVNIFDMLHCLRKVDNSTYAHCVNVAIICRLLGQWLDFSPEDIDVLTLSGLLHDIGKINSPSSILSKPSSLTPDEYNIIKKHSLDGYKILKNQPLDPRIKRAALMHHERCDGSGYPLGLMREDIDSFAVIVSIADVYDAMTTKRCYRSAICPFEVIARFEEEGFHKYNSTYVNVFLNNIVDTYMNNHVLLSNGDKGQIVWKNKNQLARPTIYLPSKEFLDLTKHPELYIEAII